ncbi:MAG: hypothetical protein A3A98_01260 [Candidatus Staskawiczbacteria bacterium RIFCSPLOWO2_01_FULL_40_39]|uniref:Prepilin-type N-terminal cleavage/methylation domain-containing protein n=1 Tax=Candidatus Staskawiczbacteria bacterium RIFCSPHIGHO2_01_FULL_39_25 TaxID=1802202 RepID=A0A1G2HPU7_9BACT|nr:MAG: hypothetical protein A2730_01260 [Candidatus Staskawiczbacteria bacterium RIFCSPHIGHO2_01_FULL_39_25]OGZ73356.1 MAG: hypothetical protein A3A98_01260 [Candidatus Staskawiczbacteria bacterium RIFCSPLOWO2_01_FULL_40_39]OGZ76877.1 MAG: hypothetical protein A3I87_00490 [Candidatus Staskawiczbacteria bacterium RIFCSPLOWO2_02_FULL_39_8]
MELNPKKSIIFEAGFTALEILVSVGVFSIILLTIISFLFWMNYSNTKTQADREALENARRVLDIINYEIRESKGIYSSTSTSNQLSLETSKYLPTDEKTTFIDFFLCGSSLCMKKESQNPFALISDSVEVTSLSFSQIANGTTQSIKTNITVSHKNPNNQAQSAASVNLTSTVSLRSY